MNRRKFSAKLIWFTSESGRNIQDEQAATNKTRSQSEQQHEKPPELISLNKDFCCFKLANGFVVYLQVDLVQPDEVLREQFAECL